MLFIQFKDDTDLNDDDEFLGHVGVDGFHLPDDACCWVDGEVVFVRRRFSADEFVLDRNVDGVHVNCLDLLRLDVHNTCEHSAVHLKPTNSINALPFYL